MRGHRFSTRFTDVQTRELTLSGDVAPLAQEALIVRHPVIWRGGSAGDHRRINCQQRAGEGDAGGDNPRRFALESMASVAVSYLARPVGGKG
ncbi:hypothetical protein D3C75_527040 [compost metagenome]